MMKNNTTTLETEKRYTTNKDIAYTILSNTKRYGGKPFLLCIKY